MFKAKNIIYSINTMESLKKITSSTGFKDMKLSFSLTKLRIQYERGKEVIEEERKKIFERLCNKKEDGSLNLTPQGQYTFDAENGTKVQDEIKKLYENTITEFNMDKISIELDQIPENLLSPDDMYNLSELIDFKEDIDEKVKNIRPKK